MRAALFCGVFAWVCLFALRANADLHSDVERVKLALASSAHLVQLKPRFLERGDVRRVFVPESLLDARDPSCVTLFVLGARSVSFVLRNLPHDDHQGSRGWPEVSVAGAAELVRCGTRKPMLANLAVEMRSPRALVEFLVVRSAQPVASIFTLLKQRSPGPAQSGKDLGPVPQLGSLDERLRRTTEGLERERPSEVVQRHLLATRSGRGEKLMRLDAGCHALTLLAELPDDEDTPVDMDAMLLAVSEHQLLAEDRSENADATINVCVGRSTITKLSFRGAPPKSSVTLVHGTWELPSGLPVHWGPMARAHMASTLGVGVFPALSQRPDASALGVQGVTRVPLEVIPGACYLVGVAGIRGELATLGLEVLVGAQVRRSRSGPSAPGASLAFCAGASGRVAVDVSARGSGLAWLLSAWQTGRTTLGAGP